MTSGDTGAAGAPRPHPTDDDRVLDLSGAALPVAAVARRLGIAPATLRTWDRRYGIGPSDHRAGAHRRYGPADLARLEHMRRLLVAGVPPAEAARAVMADDEASAVLAPGGAAGPAARGLPARPGGGTVVPLPGGAPAARGLARAAMALDGPAVSDVLRDAVDRRGVLWTWDNLLVPVLVGVGQRWESTGQGVEVEHMLSEAVVGVLRSVSDRLRSPLNPRPVLLACAPDDQHSLPLFALAAALAERRVGSRVLGARVPAQALVAAARRTGTALVVVSSQVPESAGPDAVPDLSTLRPAPRLVLAGPAWGHAERDSAQHVPDLATAVLVVGRHVGA